MRIWTKQIYGITLERLFRSDFCVYCRHESAHHTQYGVMGNPTCLRLTCANCGDSRRPGTCFIEDEPVLRKIEAMSDGF